MEEVHENTQEQKDFMSASEESAKTNHVVKYADKSNIEDNVNINNSVKYEDIDGTKDNVNIYTKECANINNTEDFVDMNNTVECANIKNTKDFVGFSSVIVSTQVDLKGIKCSLGNVAYEEKDTENDSVAKATNSGIISAVVHQSLVTDAIQNTLCSRTDRCRSSAENSTISFCSGEGAAATRNTFADNCDGELKCETVVPVYGEKLHSSCPVQSTSNWEQLLSEEEISFLAFLDDMKYMTTTEREEPHGRLSVLPDMKKPLFPRDEGQTDPENNKEICTTENILKSNNVSVHFQTVNPIIDNDEPIGETLGYENASCCNASQEPKYENMGIVSDCSEGKCYESNVTKSQYESVEVTDDKDTLDSESYTTRLNVAETHLREETREIVGDSPGDDKWESNITRNGTVEPADGEQTFCDSVAETTFNSKNTTSCTDLTDMMSEENEENVDIVPVNFKDDSGESNIDESQNGLNKPADVKYSLCGFIVKETLTRGNTARFNCSIVLSGENIDTASLDSKHAVTVGEGNITRQNEHDKSPDCERAFCDPVVTETMIYGKTAPDNFDEGLSEVNTDFDLGIAKDNGDGTNITENENKPVELACLENEIPLEENMETVSDNTEDQTDESMVTKSQIETSALADDEQSSCGLVPSTADQLSESQSFEMSTAKDIESDEAIDDTHFEVTKVSSQRTKLIDYKIINKAIMNNTIDTDPEFKATAGDFDQLVPQGNNHEHFLSNIDRKQAHQRNYLNVIMHHHGFENKTQTTDSSVYELSPAVFTENQPESESSVKQFRGVQRSPTSNISEECVLSEERMSETTIPVDSITFMVPNQNGAQDTQHVPFQQDQDTDSLVPDHLTSIPEETSENTFYDEEVEKHRKRHLKEPVRASPVFKWKYRPSCDGEEEGLDMLAEPTEGLLGNILPLVTSPCSRPLRVGLSRKQKIKRLHRI